MSYLNIVYERKQNALSTQNEIGKEGQKKINQFLWAAIEAILHTNEYELSCCQYQNPFKEDYFLSRNSRIQ